MRRENTKDIALLFYRIMDSAKRDEVYALNPWEREMTIPLYIRGWIHVNSTKATLSVMGKRWLERFNQNQYTNPL